jgi:hypothetical protein
MATEGDYYSDENISTKLQLYVDGVPDSLM